MCIRPFLYVVWWAYLDVADQRVAQARVDEIGQEEAVEEHAAPHTH